MNFFKKYNFGIKNLCTLVTLTSKWSRKHSLRKLDGKLKSITICMFYDLNDQPSKNHFKRIIYNNQIT